MYSPTDTSEYPKSHQFFCHTDDEDVPDTVQSLLADMMDQRPRALKDLLDWFCSSLAKLVGGSSSQPIEVDSDSEDGTEDEDEVFDYDDDIDLDAITVEPNTILHRLQKDFLNVVASSYKPGIIRTAGGNDFIVSVSIPVISLANAIPPRALMAWDRRLLSRYQHLTLLISGFRGLYPVIQNDGSYTDSATKLAVSLAFKVGLSQSYKPGKEQAQEAVRKHGLIINDAEDELRLQAEKAVQEQAVQFWDGEDEHDWMEDPVEVVPEVPEEPEDPGRFDRFSLTSSLETLLEQQFLRLVQLRRQFGLGWAGAELLLSTIEKSQRTAEEVYGSLEEKIKEADAAEETLSRLGTTLPDDPLKALGRDEPINLPLTAFCYLIRRLSLCTKYCVVCHNKLEVDFEVLKPYVCGNKLCSFQYYAMGRGPSLEYEIIHNPNTVDLLVSLAYVSAVEGTMDDPLPVGLALRVPHPGALPLGMYVAQAPRAHVGFMPQPVAAPSSATSDPQISSTPDSGELCDFDNLTKPEMRAVIAKLIDSLPSIDEMKKHLTRKVNIGKSKPKLYDIDPEVLPAAWLILRWIVGSCTASIEEITSEEDEIKNLDPNWRQFRLTVGAPDAEAKFKSAVEAAAKENANAREYPALYAFHGSPLRNWHSIIRHGLWYKEIAHGRAYGNGESPIVVYLDLTTNARSVTSASNCVALAEIVNLPHKFVSNNPWFVIADTTWIVCRYLLVKGASPEPTLLAKTTSTVPYVPMDPAHKPTLNQKEIQIPDPSRQVENVLTIRRSEVVQEDPDSEDMEIFSAAEPTTNGVKGSGSQSRYDEDYHMHLDDDDDYKIAAPAPKPPKVVPQRPVDDWKHDPVYVHSAVERLMLPPFEATTSATSTLQRELRAMLKEQENARSLKELGWYLPEEFIGDNLYQWIVELHSFDPDIPIAKDLKAKNINSVVFEIRFPPQFPVAPPFFRVITPRFLPFIHGGGGHVTGGGSICMDLLTADGWLPSYNIPSILLQIKLAISNLEPRPARLAPNWDQHYGVHEALEGFKRAAATHHWKVPEGLDRLVR
ncbi:hypothetical protein CC1G_05608 [Coprinopsis cinerea okayama7|uniref:UBC core domain-containing protein n=1 Tax=Coprinopsis cinerea (strain Okayama-7 / 130 / ATCC MYA-4618 / FGSC 9003) TaxID=240176 RepID=A8P1L8_COPC7|nr:hypothetical protein CC1G_05608 [Coprinopsis cinerea okayama7\|eukprot:XP_001838127.2 hypothetical protein CC1G_05608 [Coprinopsis cinerea okayama7\